MINLEKKNDESASVCKVISETEEEKIAEEEEKKNRMRNELLNETQNNPELGPFSDESEDVTEGNEDFEN